MDRDQNKWKKDNAIIVFLEKVCLPPFSSSLFAGVGDGASGES